MSGGVLTEHYSEACAQEVYESFSAGCKAADGEDPWSCLTVTSDSFSLFFVRKRSGAVAFRCHAQTTLKKVRLGIAATSVGFLPIYTAYHRGFYKDEGIDLEIILMSLAAANNAFFKGEIDYSAGLTGLALAAVRNYPAKILIFTVAKPLQSFVSRKEIKEPRDLRGKKVAGSSPGGSATILAYQALRHFGLEPGKDVTVTPMGGSGAGRLAVLERARGCVAAVRAGKHHCRAERLSRVDFFGRHRDLSAKRLRHLGAAHPAAAR